MNTNAAVFKNLGTVGKGTVIRDHAGTVIAALSQHPHLPLGPLEAEAKAMDIVVSFAWDVGVQEVIFETDSHVIFTALSGDLLKNSLCISSILLINIVKGYLPLLTEATF